ncbi:hypothetical protein AMTRI_Chr09g32970 [Amborella trichopoda]
MEDEAIKRNTDCVYFLASPLTCKNGSECEFRHSESARVNPRDCWFWLNGNCLNPKCAFRHPPLDGLLGTTGMPTANSSALALPPSVPTQTPLPAAAASTKQITPCIFFRKRLCLKGDKCPFLHINPSSSGSQATPPSVKAGSTVTDLPQPLKAPSNANGPEIPNIHQRNSPNFPSKNSPPKFTKPSPNLVKLSPPNFAKPSPPKNTSQNSTPGGIPPVSKPAMDVESSPQTGVTVRKAMVHIDEFGRSKATIAPMSCGNLINRLQVHHSRGLDYNGREPGEFFSETSPGFDVLVDEQREESDYKDLGRGRRISSLHAFSYPQSSHVDWNANPDREARTPLDRETRGHINAYDSHGRARDWLGREQSGASIEKNIERRPSVVSERRIVREESPDRVDTFDLRQQISKRRKVNGSRSVVSPSRGHGEIHQREEGLLEEQKFPRPLPHRDQPHISSETTVSRRLQGRLKLPRKSSPEFHQETSLDIRARGPQSNPSGFIGRNHERLKRRLPEVNTMEGKDSVVKGNETSSHSFNFAGPKSLAELKSGKVSDRVKSEVVVGEESAKLGKGLSQESVGSLPFDGPKPLSMILKEKREMGSGNPVLPRKPDEATEVDIEERTLAEKEGTQVEGEGTHVYENQSPESEKEENTSPNGCREELKATIPGRTAETVESEIRLISDGLSSPQRRDDVEMIDAEEDPEGEAYDQREGESDYGALEGRDWKMGEENADDNADQDDDYLDDEDGDDFARRLGVMFS